MRRVFGLRTVLEAAFLVAVPVVSLALGLGPFAIVAASAVGYLLVLLVEAMLWRDITRDQVAVPVAEPVWEALEETMNSMTVATMMEWRVSCTVNLRLWKTRRALREGQECHACPASNDMPPLRIAHRRQEMAEIATPRANRARIHPYKAGLPVALLAARFRRGRALLGPAPRQRRCHRALPCLILLQAARRQVFNLQVKVLPSSLRVQ